MKKFLSGALSINNQKNILLISENDECNYDCNPSYNLKYCYSSHWRKDNAGIARVIREVSAEHGLTADKGFAVADPILDTPWSLSSIRSAYWVVEMDGDVVGGVVSHH